VAAWADLFLPAECAGCEAPGPRLCGACAAALDAPAVLARPGPAPPGLPVVHAIGPYADPLRGVILAHKERGAHAVAGPLGRALATAVEAALRGAAWPAGPCALVPVPSARAAVRARGHDATRCLARHAAGALRARGVPARVLPVLTHHREVADQAGLDRDRRVANITGSMGVPRRLAPLFGGISVVIVDDLVTTGATLAEATRAVARAGGRVEAAAVIAATRRRGDEPVVRSHREGGSSRAPPSPSAGPSPRRHR
jgi:predicted amidophosphoribosyltransferase